MFHKPHYKQRTKIAVKLATCYILFLYQILHIHTTGEKGESFSLFNFVESTGIVVPVA